MQSDCKVIRCIAIWKPALRSKAGLQAGVWLLHIFMLYKVTT